ncbi:MAG: hypothetical protein RIR18_420 [Pseudomonadota bacterium]|jgi:hypothetical protein
MAFITEDDLKREITRLEKANRILLQTLLDDFAKAALTGFIASFAGDDREPVEFKDGIALSCYEMAIALHNAREALCVPTP